MITIKPTEAICEAEPRDHALMIAKMHTIEMLADKVLPLSLRAEADGESPANVIGMTTICRMLSSIPTSRRLEYGHRRTGAW